MHLTNFSLKFNTPFWYLLIILEIVLLIQTFRNYKKLHELVNNVNILYFLYSIRFFVILLVFYLIISPILNLTFSFKKNPKTIILVDNSISMGIKDNNNLSRLDKISNYVNDDFLKKIEKNSDIETFFFSDTLIKTNNLSNYGNLGKHTDLEKAINEIFKLDDKEAIKNLIIFSDGNFNHGKDIHYLDNKYLNNVKLFTVFTDSITSSNDVAILDVEFPEIAFINKNIELKAKVTNNSSNDIDTEILLKNSKSEIIQKNKVKIYANNSINEIPINFTPKNIGQNFYSIEIVPFKNELVKENNTFDFNINVLKDKYKVLLLCGNPDYDYRFIKMSLNNDKNININEIGILPNNKLIYSNKKYDYSNIDLIFVYNSKLNIDSRIINIINDEKIPKILWFSSVLPDKNIIKKFLDFEFKDYVSGDIVYKLHNNQENFLPLFGENNILPSELWQNLSPLTNVRIIDKYNFDKILFSTKEGNIPILSLKKFGKTSVIYINASGFWRTDMNKSNKNEPTIWQNFLQKLCFYLITENNFDFYNVTTDKKVYNVNEKIIIKTQVLDFNFKFDKDINVKCEIYNNGKLEKKVDVSDGMIASDSTGYINEVNFKNEGTYQIVADFYKNDKKISSKEWMFKVSNFNQEYYDFATNLSNLNFLSQKYNGKSYYIENIDKIDDNLYKNKIEIDYFKEFKGWHNPYLYFLIILLLSLEWYFRQKNNLP